MTGNREVVPEFLSNFLFALPDKIALHASLSTWHAFSGIWSHILLCASRDDDAKGALPAYPAVSRALRKMRLRILETWRGFSDPELHDIQQRVHFKNRERNK